MRYELTTAYEDRRKASLITIPIARGRKDWFLTLPSSATSSKLLRGSGMPITLASDTGYEVEVVFAYCLLGRREIQIL